MANKALQNLIGFYRTQSAEIRDCLEGFQYEFMSNEDYVILLANRSTVHKANRIIAHETLARCHVVAATTILRNLQWMDGIESAINSENFLAFSACLRGLVEASADSTHTLVKLPSTIAKHHKRFRSALDSEYRDVILDFGRLEEELIHYTHGRRLDKEEKKTNPDSHHAESMRRYLQALNSTSSEKLYSALCQVAHPAEPTVSQYFAATPEEQSKGRFRIDLGLDSERISTFCKDFEEAFEAVFQNSFNGAFLTFKALNFFHEKTLYTKGVKQIDLSHVPAWHEIRAIMPLK